jgi:LysM repeat protein
MPTHGHPATRSRLRARISGLGATLLLLVLLAGIPAALWVFGGGNPIPTSLPSMQEAKTALLSPDNGTLFLHALLIIGWLAWATFAFSVLVEAFAALRGVRAPHLPGLGLQQRSAAGLIALVALMFTAGQAGAATLAMPTTGPALAPVSVSAQLVDSAPAPTQAATPATPTTAPTVAYTVKAGDTPWGIAETLLGDGAHYPQILAGNYGVPQADGGALAEGNWLQPGWVLQVPAPHTTATPASVAEATGAGTVTVHPGDTLTGIAEHQLGDPALATTLFDTNAGLAQANGHTLTNPDLIDAGWTLAMPAPPATAPAAAAAVPAPPLAPPAQSTPDTQQQAAAAQNQAAATAASQAAAQQQAAAAQAAAAAPAPSAAAQATPSAPAQATSAPDTTASSTTATATASSAEQDSGVDIRTAAGVGSLLAAGVLGLLAVRRRNQQRHRAPGASIAMPTGPVADTEHELRSIAAPLDITMVDLALRTLAFHCRATDQPLPYVRAARLTREQFELYLGEPAQLPPPWAGTTDATVWTLPNDVDDDELITDEQADTIAAPYPSLVTIGHDLDGAHVFLDLEEAGALALTGDPTDTTEVITALALELATSQWADDLQVTVVGACSDLEAGLRTGRVRYLPDTGSVLADLNQRAGLDRDTLTDVGSPDLHHTRPDGSTPGIAVPEIVLIAGDIDPDQRASLDALLDALPRVAVAAVTHGAPVGEWSLTLSDTDDTAVLAPIGLTLRPQRVDARTYAHLIEAQLLADHDTTTTTVVDEPQLQDLPAPVAEDPSPAPATEAETAEVEVQVLDAAPAPASAVQALHEQPVAKDIPAPVFEIVTAPADTVTDPAATPTPLEPAGTPVHALAAAGGEGEGGGEDATVRQLHPAPRILILGPVHIEHLPTHVEAKDKLVELLTYIALYPGGNHVAIDDAIAPGRPQSDNARNSRMARARAMLGRAADGTDYLPRHTGPDGYRLDPAVTTDWQQWLDLLPDGPTTARTEDLEAALTLVRGRPFAGFKPRYYAWAERLLQEIISAIVDVAWELGRRRLLEGRHQAAAAAVAIGLDVEPGMERLARLQILAAHAGGNPDAAQAAIGRLLDITDELGGDLEDVTEQLIHDLANPGVGGRRELVDAYAR